MLTDIEFKDAEMFLFSVVEHVSSSGLTLVERVKITPDSGIIPEVGYVIFKNQSNELFRYYYYVDNNYGVTHVDDAITRVELKQVQRNEYVEI